MTQRRTRLARDAAQHTLSANPLDRRAAARISSAAPRPPSSRRLARQPLNVEPQLRPSSHGELSRIVATGGSTRSPRRRGSRRFADASWTRQPGLSPAAAGLPRARRAPSIADTRRRADGNERDAERARFVVSLLVGALAPTNFLAGNPEALPQDWATTKGTSDAARAREPRRRSRRAARGCRSRSTRGPFKVGSQLWPTPAARWCFATRFSS